MIPRETMTDSRGYCSSCGKPSSECERVTGCASGVRAYGQPQVWRAHRLTYEASPPIEHENRAQRRRRAALERRGPR